MGVFAHEAGAQIVLEVIARDLALETGVHVFVIDGRVLIAAGAYFDLDLGFGFGRHDGCALDHAEGGGRPEEPTEIYRFAQVGDLGLVDRALWHALSKELEFAYRTDQGLGGGALIGLGIHIQQREHPTIAEEALVLAAEVYAHLGFEISVYIDDDEGERVDITFEYRRLGGHRGGDLEGGDEVGLQRRTIGAEALTGRDKAKGHRWHRHGQVHGEGLFFDQVGPGRVIRSGVGVDEPGTVFRGVGDAVVPLPHPRHFAILVVEDSVAGIAPKSPVVNLGKDRFFGVKIRGLNGTGCARKVDKEPRGVVFAPGQTAATQLPMTNLSRYTLRKPKQGDEPDVDLGAVHGGLLSQSENAEIHGV